MSEELHLQPAHEHFHVNKGYIIDLNGMDNLVLNDASDAGSMDYEQEKEEGKDFGFIVVRDFDLDRCLPRIPFLILAVRQYT